MCARQACTSQIKQLHLGATPMHAGRVAWCEMDPYVSLEIAHHVHILLPEISQRKFGEFPKKQWPIPQHATRHMREWKTPLRLILDLDLH